MTEPVNNLYYDKYGDIWKYTNGKLIRLRDNCIGGWLNGNGLWHVE